MKKILLFLTVLVSSATLCLASDGGDLAKAQKTADTMLAVFAGKKVPAYKTLAATFSPQLAGKLTEGEYTKLKKQVDEKFGRMTESRFVAFRRFDKADRLTYFAGFTKEKVVALTFGIDKSAKLLEFRLAPVKPQPAPDKAAGQGEKAEPAKASK